ncbi:deoxyribodipyrimidine photo-lyase [Motiliproteus sp. SC1-56]|uniref:cryptochrome/photolyase family protein n=1 Tax=Motiliproteus sp. SC1-56 TaxID=2799565 RepID=UPI001A90302F|nr:deoxyribodipyrimidine photo-lyase [Motiliproteus sp. SC1-56]
MAGYQRSLFLFRRDLRLDDNRGLNAALVGSEEVLPAFILDPRQQAPHPYRSEPGLAFLFRALAALDQALGEKSGRLHCYRGDPESLLASLVERLGIDALFVNRDYTPFSRDRDAGLARACRSLGIGFHPFADALLTEPEEIAKSDGSAYRVFTPFYRRARQLHIDAPEAMPEGRWLSDAAAEELPRDPALAERWPMTAAGAKAAEDQLARLDELGDYDNQRDLPAINGTSGLSPALKFGTCSVRRAYHRACEALGADHSFVRQLYWRDFLVHVAWHWPHVFEGAFDRRFDALEWNNDEAAFERWCEGRTGFPLVDAGMRQLNRSGEMHNRLRMVTAAFLVKDLHIDWRRGEAYFARKLVDYDPCLNNGNWQWVASTGCDAQPWFRVFNPWRQQRRFDPQAAYIRRWVDELAELEPAQIHGLEKGGAIEGYPAPMVDHREEAEETKARYRRAARG